MYIVQRTQIYLDDAQTSVLDERARAAKRTRSDLIREAIDRYLAEDARTEAVVVAAQKEALLALFGAAPHLGDELARLRAVDVQREKELDARWDEPG